MKIIDAILGFPKTLVFNIKSFKFLTAIKLPVILDRRCTIKNKKGKFLINSQKIQTGMVKIGFSNVNHLIRKKTVIYNYGTVIFNKGVFIGNGSEINNHGTLVFGKKTVFTASTEIVCYNKITFGDYSLISYNTSFFDFDEHTIVNHDYSSNEILIGNNVWVCKGAYVLKNSVIADGCIVGAKSLVNKRFLNENMLIAGVPAKEIKQVKWKR